MSFRNDASADEFDRTTNNLGGTGDRTVMLCCRQAVDQAAFQALFYFGDDTGAYAGGEVYFGSDSSGNSWDCGVDSNYAGAAGTFPAVNVWFWAAYTRTVDDHNFRFWRLGTDTSWQTARANFTDAMTHLTAGFHLGQDGNATPSWFDGRMACLMEWTRSLTVEQLTGQVKFGYPVDGRGLRTYIPFHGLSGVDRSGNAFNFTAQGTTTQEANPPLVYHPWRKPVLPTRVPAIVAPIVSVLGRRIYVMP